MSEEIDRWIAYMKEHPHSWKKVHSEFINSQFQKAESFLKRLSKEPSGRKKIISAYGIKNIDGYSRLLTGRKS